LLYNEFKGLVFTCTDAQKIKGVCPIPNGTVYLETLGVGNVVVWKWALVLVSMIFIYRAIAFIALTFLYQEKR